MLICCFHLVTVDFACRVSCMPFRVLFFVLATLTLMRPGVENLAAARRHVAKFTGHGGMALGLTDKPSGGGGSEVN